VKGIDLGPLPMAGFVSGCYETSGFRKNVFQLYKNIFILALFFVTVIILV
jgi:hypothetical protein